MSRIQDIREGDKVNATRRTERYKKILNMSIDELEQEIEESLVPLVTDTHCVVWRDCLTHAVQFSLQDTLVAIIKYFQHLISTAIHVHDVDPSRPHEIPLESLDMAKPANLSSEQWRKLVLALNLEIEEPDSNFDLRFTTVIVPKDLSRAALEGYLLTLQALLDVGVGHPKSLCQLNMDEGQNIYALLHQVLPNKIIELPHRHPILVPVWAKYTRTRDLLESFGVKQQKTHGLKVVTFPSEGEIYQRLQLAYFLSAALFSDFQGKGQQQQSVIVSAL
ncbi:uncharacterized protein [Ptychodera flava]